MARVRDVRAEYADIARVTDGQTVATAFRDTVARQGGEIALRWRDDAGQWRSWSWSDYADTAGRIATGLRRLGVRPGDRVVLLVRNVAEFHALDTGVLLAGATPVSLYNSSAPEQIAHLAGHCAATVAVVEDAGFLDRLQPVRAQLPDLRAVVCVRDGDSSTTPYAELLDAEPRDLDEAAAGCRPDGLATVIYTSGTTGSPKGVMITHRNVAFGVEGFNRMHPWDMRGLRHISYLPMAHIAERALSLYGHIVKGTEVTDCPDQSQLLGYFVDVRPELLFGPPRVFEKLAAGIRTALYADPERAATVDAALAVGREVATARGDGELLTSELAARWEAVDAAVFGPIRERAGLGAAKTIISGAAPIPAGLVGFLRGIGLPFSEVYGMSENTGAMTWEPILVRPGWVGRAVPGVELGIAADGEVCCRGGIVCPGYLGDPERTAEALDGDGWLHSGDIGELSDDGYLRIVDRKKELIITAGGKNISPANLEAALKEDPLIGQACVVGDDRPYLTALLVLDPEVAPAWAAARGTPAVSLAELGRDPDLRAAVEQAVEAVNARFSRVEQIKRFELLGEEWVPDSAELTPTMKLKRRGVLAKYADVIDTLYR